MFQAVLFVVIAYLAACYGYGLYLLWKLYTGRRLDQGATTVSTQPHGYDQLPSLTKPAEPAVTAAPHRPARAA